MNYLNNNPIIIGIDHGYGNIKTAHTCFRTGVTAHDREPTFKNDLLIYEGRYYTIGEGHKEFAADKMTDGDYYILTLAAIGRELNIRKINSARIYLAAGLPLTWVSEQKDAFRAYLLPSEAEARGLVRADKHPKSTRYGRQNPISERWNSEEQLVSWRAAWADVSNRYLERAGFTERIDHRSNAERGLDTIPTIHEGPVARALERQGVVSFRCEINRQIREQNRLIRALRAEIQKLTEAIKSSVPALARALETARKGILLLRYSWLYHTGAARKLDESIQAIQPDYARYLEIRKLLREKAKQKKDLTAELRMLNPLNLMRRAEIKKALATLTEDMEELRSEMDMLIAGFGKGDPDGMKEVKQQLDALNANKTGLEDVAAKAADALDAEVQKYHALQEQSEAVDAEELHTARMELRGNMTAEVREKIKDTFGKHYDADRFRQADREVSELLGEPHPQKDRSIVRKLKEPQEQSVVQTRKHNNEMEL